MAFIVAIGLVLISFVIGVRLTRGKSHKRKWLIWGLLFIFGIGPFSSWMIGIGYGVSVGDGFAAMGAMLGLYALFFIIGLVSVIYSLLIKS